MLLLSAISAEHQSALTPSPLIELNRAVAVSMAFGSAAALVIVGGLLTWISRAAARSRLYSELIASIDRVADPLAVSREPPVLHNADKSQIR